MKSSTAKNKYLRQVKFNAEVYHKLITALNEKNINLSDPDLPYEYEHLIPKMIRLKSSIHWKGFKYRLEVQYPRNKN